MGAPKLPAGRYSTSQAAKILKCNRLRLIASLENGILVDGNGDLIEPERDDHNRRMFTLDEIKEIAICDFNTTRIGMEDLKSIIRSIIIERRKIDVGDG